MSIFEEPAEQRAQRYIDLAESARRYADRTTDPTLKRAHLEIAQGWEQLALDLERKLNEPIIGTKAAHARPILKSV